MTDQTRNELDEQAPTVDDRLAAIANVDARTRAGKAVRHAVAEAERALRTERRDTAKTIRELTETRDRTAREAQALVATAQQEANAIVNEYQAKIVTLGPDYTEGEPATITSPRHVVDGGRRSSSEYRAFTLQEAEEALIRFRVAGAGDLAPIELSEGNYRRGSTITCHVRDELMEAREERDARLAREAAARTHRRVWLAVGAVVVPPVVLLLAAVLRWTYTLLLGWVL